MAAACNGVYDNGDLRINFDPCGRFAPIIRRVRSSRDGVMHRQAGVVRLQMDPDTAEGVYDSLTLYGSGADGSALWAATFGVGELRSSTFVRIMLWLRIPPVVALDPNVADKVYELLERGVFLAEPVDRRCFRRGEITCSVSIRDGE